MSQTSTQVKKLLDIYHEVKGKLKFAKSKEECLKAEIQTTIHISKMYKNALSDVKCLKLQYFDECSEFTRFQDIPKEFFISTNAVNYFVSHQWESINHPDPTKRQFNRLRRYFENTPKTERESTGVWYDYSCIPQRDTNGERSSNEEKEFQSQLKLMHLLPMTMPTVIMCDEDYLDRSWCCFEWLFATWITPLPFVPREAFPFGNAIKYRQLALIIMFLKMDSTSRASFFAGKDEYMIPFLNSLMERTMRGTKATLSCDKSYLQSIIHRHLWYHLRVYGLRSQLLTGFLLLEQYPADFVEVLFKQFLIISGDADLKWTEDALVDMDLMLLKGGDDFEQVPFHKLNIQIQSNSLIRHKKRNNT
jgi:hypothetical protein